MKSRSNIVYVQISAGRGPAECAWVVAQVLKEMLAAMKVAQVKAQVISRSKGQEAGTLNSCLIQLEGAGTLAKVKPWIGSIQWIGKSPFRKFHKRKNWFVGVSTFIASEAQTFRSTDLEFSTFRSSGPGGQHRNKVETAVRVLHKPSGVTVTASDSKSQMQNKKAAIEKIKLALKQHEIDQMQEQIEGQWKGHLSLQRGNPIKVFEGWVFKEKNVKRK